MSVKTSINASISGLSMTNFTPKSISFSWRATSSTKLDFRGAEPPAPNRLRRWSSASVWSFGILAPNCKRKHSLSPTASLINCANNGTSSNRFSQNGHRGSTSLALAIVESPSITEFRISIPESRSDCPNLFFPPTRPRQ